jgi:hypothetical protein
LGLPFLDGRLHYNYDNALFTTYARAGILLGDPRSQLGVTQVHFESWGKPAGAPSYYTHHPFLFKAIFQLWVRAFGEAEASSRAFALLVAIAVAAGTTVALALATESALAAGLGAAVMVATPVFALFEVCIKYELEGMAIGAWLLATTFLYLRRPSRAAFTALAVLAILAPLTHWTAIILVATLVGWLTLERAFGAREATGPLVALAAGAALGGVLLLATMAWLKGGWGPFWTDQTHILQVRQDVSAFGAGVWADRQRFFATFNFPPLLLWTAGLLATAHAARWAIRRWSAAPPKRSAAGRALPAFFFCTLITASIWVFAFPQASFIHNFMQLWYVLPLAALIAATAGDVRSGAVRRLVVATALGLLAVWLVTESSAVTRRVIAEQLGTVDEVAFLKSLRNHAFDRFLFIPTRDDRLNGWFTGPIFEYYAARSVNIYDPGVTPGPGDKILLLRSADQGALLAQLGSALGIELVHETCATRLCAYDVVRP